MVVASGRSARRWGTYLTSGVRRALATIAIAAVGLVALYWWGYPTAPHHTEHASAKPYCQYTDTSPRATKQKPPIARIIICFQASAESGGKQVEEADSQDIRDFLPLTHVFARKVLADPISLFTLVLALFTWRLIVVGRDQHTAAMRALKLAQDEFISTHRPRLVVRNVYSYWTVGMDGQDISVSYSISNTGDTTAHIIAMTTYCEWFSDKSAVVLPVAPIPPVVTKGPTINGGQTIPFATTTDIVWEFNKMRTATDQADERDRMGAVLGDGTGLYFVGHIVYVDDRDVRRNTVFRRRYDFSQQRFVATTGDMELDYAD
jgi:hypothetical protein